MCDFKPVTERTVIELQEKIPEILHEAVKLSMTHKEEIEHHGVKARQLITSGYEFTLKMLLAAMETGDRILLDDQAKWAVNRLPHDGIAIPHLIKRVDRLLNVVQKKSSDDQVDEVKPYFKFLIERIKEFSK